MAYLYQSIMGVPGLTGNSMQRQQQLYEKLGSPMGAYSGSLDQNNFLLGHLSGGLPASSGGPAPSSSGGETGGGGLPSWSPSAPDIQGLMKPYNQAASDLPGAINQEYSNLGKTLQGNIQGGISQGSDIINKAYQQFNVPQLSQEATALGNRINALSSNAAGAGVGGYASADQINNAIQTNLLPREQQATAQAQTASTLAQGQATPLLGLVGTGMSAQANLLAQQATGFSDAKKSQLDALLQLPQLTEQQWQTASDLASQEQQYETTRYQAQLGLQGAQLGLQGTQITAAANRFGSALGAGYQVDTNPSSPTYGQIDYTKGRQTISQNPIQNLQTGGSNSTTSNLQNLLGSLQFNPDGSLKLHP